MKIVYTDSGQVELESFKKKQIALLEESISRRKYAFGDETVEITASDIREAAEKIRLITRRRSPFSSVLTEIFPKIYILLGVGMALGGLAYPYLREVVAKDDPQFAFTVGGVGIALLGLLMQYFFRVKNRAMDEIRYDAYMKRNADFLNELRNIDIGPGEIISSATVVGSTQKIQDAIRAIKKHE